MKSICIVIPYSYPVPAIKGGAVETLVQFLIEQNEIYKEFKFTILCTYDNEAKLQGKNYEMSEFIYFKQRKIKDKMLAFCHKLFKKVFGVYLPYSVRFIEIQKYLKKNTFYDFVLFENGISYMLPLIGKYYNAERILNHLHWYGDGNKKLDQYAKYLLPVSEFIAQKWSQSTEKSEDNIYVWDNCYNSDAYGKELSSKEKRELKNSLDISSDEKVVIFVGRVIKGKGVRELILALNELKNISIRLLVIGSSSFGNSSHSKYEKEVFELIKTVRYKVNCLGYVHNSELYKYYCISDIAVVPSIIDEAAGMVNIEALATGTPLVSTSKGGICEYVGDAGIIVPVKESFVCDLSQAINDLLLDSELCKKLSLVGKSRAQQFTPTKYYNRFKEIIDDITNKKNGGEV